MELYPDQRHPVRRPFFRPENDAVSMNQDFYRMTHNYHTNDKEKTIDLQRLRRMNPNYLTYYRTRICPEGTEQIVESQTNRFCIRGDKRNMRDLKHQLFLHFNTSLEAMNSVKDHDCNIKISKRQMEQIDKLHSENVANFEGDENDSEEEMKPKKNRIDRIKQHQAFINDENQADQKKKDRVQHLDFLAQLEEDMKAARKTNEIQKTFDLGTQEISDRATDWKKKRALYKDFVAA